MPPEALYGASGCKMCCGGSRVLDWDPYLQAHCGKLHALVRAAGLVFIFVCFSKVYSCLKLSELVLICSALECCVLCPCSLSSLPVLPSHHLCCGGGGWSAGFGLTYVSPCCWNFPLPIYGLLWATVRLWGLKVCYQMHI